MSQPTDKATEVVDTTGDNLFAETLSMESLPKIIDFTPGTDSIVIEIGRGLSPEEEVALAVEREQDTHTTHVHLLLPRGEKSFSGRHGIVTIHQDGSIMVNRLRGDEMGINGKSALQLNQRTRVLFSGHGQIGSFGIHRRGLNSYVLYSA
ncbi:hypothetical protein KC640_02550 [Candidatus Dojkabacteria bacterium]|uniref:Uncharacterized protein n=1 Tax=Candidatus Dojkabacteria bacterium TaxID=2099670 RepID=A0A955I7L7_9BACT|nr:hypothetical protein [Candidatus Dojkabacteria bacterium]